MNVQGAIDTLDRIMLSWREVIFLIIILGVGAFVVGAATIPQQVLTSLIGIALYTAGKLAGS